MNNLLSYCGIVDAKTRASDKDFPVQQAPLDLKSYLWRCIPALSLLLRFYGGELRLVDEDKRMSLVYQKCVKVRSHYIYHWSIFPIVSVQEKVLS